MIEIDIQNFFIVYLVLCLGVLVILAVRERRRRSGRDERKQREHMCVCPQCRHLFVMRYASTGPCPHCGHLCRVLRKKNSK